MKKNIYLIVFLLAATFVWDGCNKAGKLSQQSKEQTPPTGPVQLVQKWTDGEQIVKHIDMKMNMEIALPNSPNPMKQEVALMEKYGLAVSKPDSNGGKVEMEFLSMRLSSSQNGQTIFTYDSDVKGNTPTDPTTAGMIKGMQGVIGAKLDFLLNATNGVDRIEGVDTMLKRMSGGGPAMNNSGMKNMFSKGNLEQMIGESQYLPTQAVQPADTWPVEVEMDLGEMGTLTVNNNITFAQWEKHGPRLCARLEFQGTFQGKPAKANPKGMSMAIQDGTTSGVCWFDPELGTVIDSDVNQDLTMSMTFPMPAKKGAKPTLKTMKMDMHQVMNVKLDSVK